MKPNLLFHSNAPHVGTGYGQQCALFIERLKHHYNLAVSAFYGVLGAPIAWNGVPIFPGLERTYGNEAITQHANIHFDGDLRNGLVVSLMDVWVLDPAVWRQFNYAPWVPIDHEPCPPPISAFLHDSLSVPIAMSRFGERMLRDAGLDPLYVPHGIDTTVYKPVPKAEAREATGMPADAFIVGMVAANKGNPSRKCFAEALEAFKHLHDRHDDARLYLHTEITGMVDGVDLPALMDNVGLPRSAVMFADQYRTMFYPFAQDRMAQVYSSLDVLLAPSAGEGFGIPVVEAQACGVPVIVSDFSAQPELVGAGWLVKGQRKYTPLMSWQFNPDVADIYDALRCAYAQRDMDKSEQARAHALKYDIARVMDEFMLPALRTAAERFEERQPVTLKAAA